MSHRITKSYGAELWSATSTTQRRAQELVLHCLVDCASFGSDLVKYSTERERIFQQDFPPLGRRKNEMLRVDDCLDK